MKKAWFVLGLLIVGMGSASAATLVPQKGVSILFINGQKSQSKIGENQINDGYNQLVVRFDHNYGNSSGVYTSSPYVIMFDVAGEEIKIKPPKARSKMEAQKIFEADKPKWRVVEDDREIKYQQGIIEGKDGFLPFGGLDKQLAKYNESNAIYFKDGALIAKPAGTIIIAPAKVASANAISSNKTEGNQSQTVEQLKAWYFTASKQERKEFRKWMIDQE